MSKHQEAKASRFSPVLLAGILVALFFGISLCIRVYLPYDRVFSGEWIKFTGIDVYYYMHQIDNLVHNFPHHMGVDPYFAYPGATGVITIRFFGWLLADLIWVIGLGSPTQHTIDVVGAYFPAVLGALTVIPVYFIGKELFNRGAGVLSAGLIAIMPGEFLGRSILGFTDSHVAETLFTTVTILFLILAVKTARERQLTFSQLNRRDWARSIKPLIYSLLAGIFLGIYLLTWPGALLFVFIISVYFLIQFIIDHLKHKSTDYLCLVGAILFLVALLVFLPISPRKLYLASVVIALLIPLVLSGVSWLMTSRAIKPAYYPLTLLGLGLAGLAIFRMANPSLLASMLGAFSMFFAPTGAQLTTIEMQPLLFPGGEFTTKLAWGNFTTGFFLWPARPFLDFSLILLVISLYAIAKKQVENIWLYTAMGLLILMTILANFTNLFTVQPDSGLYNFPFPGFGLISLVVLIYLVVKQGSAEKSLLVVWSLVILAAALGQRRFAYYLAVNVALLTGYLSWKILELAGFKALVARPVEMPGKQDYYEVLGVPRNATDKQIKRAFRELAFQYRPDRDDAGGAGERFKEINQAYEVLSDRHKRAAYERSEYGMAKREKAGRKKGGFRITDNHIKMALAVIVVFFLVFFPNISPARATASEARFAPSDAWCNSLSWLKENTPEPFGDPDAYYGLHEPPPPGEKYTYPESAYGVLAWWDYGYWITRMAHRIPVANPGQDPRALTTVAGYFTSQDEDSANEIIGELNSPYIIIDYDTATGKFWAVVTWAGRERTEFFDIYHVPQEDELMPVQLFHPGYYRSLSTRLYNFDGKAVTPDRVIVISSEERVSQEGKTYKQITSAKEFDNYEEAEAYLLSQESDNYKIVSDNPFASPVPLEALKHYRLIHGSSSGVAVPGDKMVPSVKIFEYID